MELKSGQITKNGADTSHPHVLYVCHIWSQIGMKPRSGQGQNLKQDRRWNTDKPTAALDPYIPTWLTTSPANHRPANLWKYTFFFEALEGNCEMRCNLSLNWWGSISNLNSHSLILQVQTITYIIYQYTGNVNIFPLCHSRQVNVATWFSVLPIDIENLYRLSRGLIYIYIYIHTYMYLVLA